MRRSSVQPATPEARPAAPTRARRPARRGRKSLSFEHGVFAAVHSPEEDRIQFPEPELFAEGGSYDATALHELIQGTSRR